MAATQSQAVVVRWMLQPHLPRILEIEEESFAWPWSYKELGQTYLSKNVVGLIAEQGEAVLGFAFCAIYNTAIDILNLAVAPEARRVGVGSLLVNRIKSDLLGGCRRRLMADVWEYNVAGQLFFRKNGFKYRYTVKDAYEVDGIYTSGDAYHMTYALGSKSKRSRG